MKRLSNLITILLSATAIIVLGLVAWKEVFSAASDPVPTPRKVNNWENLASNGSLLGSEDAALRIVNFSDFQCPFCAQAHRQLRALQQNHPGAITIVFRHLPLEVIHPHAFTAALAAECARAQGRFEAYHDALFFNQDSIGLLGWEQFGERAGVSHIHEFKRCIAERDYEFRVSRDLADAERVGARGTPTFIFDGKMVSGIYAMELLNSWVVDALDKQDNKWVR